AEASGALHPFDTVRLEEARNALRHLLHDAGLPRIRRTEVELRLADVDAELREALLCLLQRERGLHPRLRRNAADAQARAAELRLLLDARDLRAELCGANRCGIAAGAAPEHGDVYVHISSLVGNAVWAMVVGMPSFAGRWQSSSACSGRSRSGATARRYGCAAAGRRRSSACCSSSTAASSRPTA